MPAPAAVFTQVAGTTPAEFTTVGVATLLAMVDITLEALAHRIVAGTTLILAQATIMVAIGRGIGV